MKLKKKLTTNKGVSILLALFLFLVCATVGSVVLTAGTAASGRRAQIEAADQRYYSVSSSASIIKKLVTENEVTVKRTCVAKESTTYTLIKDEAGHSSRTGSPSTSDPVYTYDNDLKGRMPSGDILLNLAASLIKGYDDSQGQKFGYDSEIALYSGADSTFSYTLTHETLEGIDTSVLNTAVVIELKPNGDFDVLISSPGEKDRYCVRQQYQLLYHEDISEEAKESDVPEISPDSENKYTETYNTETTMVKTGTFTWKYIGTQTVNGGLAPEPESPAEEL